MNAIGVTTATVLLQPVAFNFDALFESDYRRLSRVIARVVRDHGRAEELAVEAFWRLWNHPDAHGPSAKGWLHRTAIRLALDELRRQARRLRYESLSALIGFSHTPHDLFSSSQEQGRVRAVLASMPRRQAELLLLHTEGFAYAELADALSLNPSSVGTLLRRARASFRKGYVKRHGEQ